MFIRAKAKNITGKRLTTLGAILVLAASSLAGSNLNAEPLSQSTSTAFNQQNASDYPLMLRKKGVQGSVTLSYDVNPEGKAVNIRKVGKAHNQLFVAAKNVLKQERFATTVANGQPLASYDNKRRYRFDLTNLDERGRLIKNAGEHPGQHIALR